MLHVYAVFPAPAGMNRSMTLPGFFPLSVPRACGDEPFDITLAPDLFLCSPRLRG